LISGTSKVHVVAGTGVTNSFDSNGIAGISATGTSVLTFDGGSASSNKGNGLDLSNGALKTAPNVVSGLIAKSNGTSSAPRSGVVSDASTSLQLRSSVMLLNTGAGLWFSYGAINALDIGFAGTPGNNEFNAADPLKRNHIGVCLDQSPATGLQPADTDQFSACPVTQTAVTGGCTSAINGATNLEVAYKSKIAVGGTDPLLITGCAVGP
jgi:hypothetical protein